MCKEGWLVQLGQEDCARVGGTVWNTWKGVGHKRGEGKQRFLKGEGQAGSRGGRLKKKGGGAETSYEQWVLRGTLKRVWYMPKLMIVFTASLEFSPYFLKKLKKFWKNFEVQHSI